MRGVPAGRHAGLRQLRDLDVHGSRDLGRVRGKRTVRAGHRQLGSDVRELRHGEIRLHCGVPVGRCKLCEPGRLLAGFPKGHVLLHEQQSWMRGANLPAELHVGHRPGLLWRHQLHGTERVQRVRLRPILLGGWRTRFAEP